jgi:hypothetical protein
MGISARLTAAAVILLVIPASGCLLIVPAPVISQIPDQSAAAGEEFTLELMPFVESQNRQLSFTCTIDGGGWQSSCIEAAVLTLTFSEPGTHRITVTVSNGLRSAESSFTLTVSE